MISRENSRIPRPCSKGGWRDPVDLLAYPFGAYDRRVASAVAQSGYRAAFAEDASGDAPVCFEMPRMGLYSSDRHYLNAKLCGSASQGAGADGG